MQKQLNNGIATQPNVNVFRAGRKVFFSGEISEDSIFELIRILNEIEEEDDSNGNQGNVENTMIDVLDAFEIKNDKLSKEELNEIEKIGNEYRKNKEKPNSLDREPIHLYISTRGGDAYECWGLIDTIRTMKTPVWGYTYKAMSAGFFILIACDRRFMYQNGTLLYHQMQTGSVGSLQDIIEDTEEAMRMQYLVEDLTLDCTNIPEERLNEIREKKIDWYIDSQTALELGIVDEII